MRFVGIILFTVAVAASANVSSKQSIGYYDSNAKLTLLHSGDALLIGEKVRKFNHSTAIWESTAQLNVPRIGQNSLTLEDGRVLVVGGWSGSNYVYQPEIYDQSSNQWTLLPASQRMHRNGAMVQLNAKEVLIIGRDEKPIDYKCNVASIYNFETFTWTDVTGPGVYCLAAKAHRLPSGKVMILSEVNSFTPYIFDPQTQKWTFAPRIEGNNGISVSTFSGDVFIAVNSGGASYPQAHEASLIKFSESQNKWLKITSLPGDHQPNMSSGLLAPNGKLVFYGYNDKLRWYDGSVYNPASKKWSSLAQMSLGITHSGQGFKAALLSDSQLLIIAPSSLGESELIAVPN